jgi:hypothetical protein
MHVPLTLDIPCTGLQKGDSGSWVLDTSDPSRYKVLGSTIAASNSAAYFVQLRDHFSEMLGDVNNDPQASLTPTFRALAQCAHISFRRNDPSSEWFIDQAFLPRTLEQLRTGWYLPAIQGLLGVRHDQSKELPTLEQWSKPNIDAFKGLLLRYGAALLDSLPWGSDFIQQHGNELSQTEKRVVRELSAAAKPLARDETSRVDQHPTTQTTQTKIEAKPSLDSCTSTQHCLDRRV